MKIPASLRLLPKMGSRGAENIQKIVPRGRNVKEGEGSAAGRRPEACRAEAALKKMPRMKKLDWAYNAHGERKILRGD